MRIAPRTAGDNVTAWLAGIPDPACAEQSPGPCASGLIYTSFMSHAGTTPSTPVQWTTRSLLKWMASTFAERGLDSPRLCAELLLSHVLGCDRMRLYMDADRPAAPLEREALRGLVARALRHEPVQYLVGEAWFFSLPFHVDPRVLIPRHCTEIIVEHVLQHQRAEPGFAPGGVVTLADICTGSGCIAVSLLKNLPSARAVAV
ncbi:MAG: peptide chain release factor N(5)-glutamine methyltransferase, partial [Phycisphaerae bacterium]|nr:peptide chain release factor N(5)-glutamine methyltransferase [Phycisphaerae bacterium]